MKSAGSPSPKTMMSRQQKKNARIPMPFLHGEESQPSHFISIFSIFKDNKKRQTRRLPSFIEEYRKIRFP